MQAPGEMFAIRPFMAQIKDRKVGEGSGKRKRVKTDKAQGRYVKYAFAKGKPKDIAFDATFRAAAPFQHAREKRGLAMSICSSDIREKVREKRVGTTLFFVVDASGSMGANQRMKAVKGAVISLLNDAYQKRDQVGLIVFRKDAAELVLGPTRSVDLAHKKLKELPTGGRTPLAAGLNKAYEVIKAEMLKDPDVAPLIILVSDGRSNVAFDGQNPVDDCMKQAAKIGAAHIKTLVVDTESGFVCLGLAEKIAKAMQADYCKLDELAAENIVAAVKEVRM